MQIAEEVLNALVSCVLVFYTPEIGHSSDILLYLMVAQVVLHMVALVAAIGLGVYAILHARPPKPRPPPPEAPEEAKLYEPLDKTAKREAPDLNFDEINSRVPALPTSTDLSSRQLSPQIIPITPPQDLLAPNDQKPQFSPITRSR